MWPGQRLSQPLWFSLLSKNSVSFLTYDRCRTTLNKNAFITGILLKYSFLRYMSCFFFCNAIFGSVRTVRNCWMITYLCCQLHQLGRYPFRVPLMAAASWLFDYASSVTCKTSKEITNELTEQQELTWKGNVYCFHQLIVRQFRLLEQYNAAGNI